MPIHKGIYPVTGKIQINKNNVLYASMILMIDNDDNRLTANDIVVYCTYYVRTHYVFVEAIMNLTLSIDETLIKRAREAARAQGKSVNQMVREYLQQLTAADERDAISAEFRRTSGKGHRKGWQFNRNELHERA